MFNLLEGDCLDVMTEIETDSVDAVIVDPPYGTTACQWDSIIPLDPMWEHLKRITKSDSAIVIMAAQPFTTMLISSNIKMFKYCWVWEKNTGTNFFHAQRQPIRYTEDIVVFMDGACHYNPQKTYGHIPANSGIGRNTGNIYSGESSVDYHGGSTQRFPRNIIKFDTVNNYDLLIPTQKPVPLMEYLVKTYTNMGDVVLDFAMGSGTTGIACVQTGRDFIGIEIDKESFKKAKASITQAEARITGSLINANNDTVKGLPMFMGFNNATE